MNTIEAWANRKKETAVPIGCSYLITRVSRMRQDFISIVLKRPTETMDEIEVTVDTSKPQEQYIDTIKIKIDHPPYLLNIARLGSALQAPLPKVVSGRYNSSQTIIHKLEYMQCG